MRSLRVSDRAVATDLRQRLAAPLREGASQARTASAPANLAALRNRVIAVFRHAGHVNIAYARNLHANNYERVRTLFNL